jgi:hypothetical protein
MRRIGGWGANVGQTQGQVDCRARSQLLQSSSSLWVSHYGGELPRASSFGSSNLRLLPASCSEALLNTLNTAAAAVLRVTCNITLLNWRSIDTDTVMSHESGYRYMQHLKSNATQHTAHGVLHGLARAGVRKNVWEVALLLGSCFGSTCLPLLGRLCLMSDVVWRLELVNLKHKALPKSQ